MSAELQALWSDLLMCEYYLDNYIGRISKQYYERLRHATLKSILELQLEEFDAK